MKTQSQQDMELAAKLVGAVAAKYRNVDDKERKTFGGLCHSFPIMVRTCGLCQALAFSIDKATVSGNGPSDINIAHHLLLDHTGWLLFDRVASQDEVLRRVREGSVVDYMLDTRRVLSAWVFWKRFAVSILKVENARDQEGVSQ